jgi:hypothetical protein
MRTAIVLLLLLSSTSPAQAAAAASPEPAPPPPALSVVGLATVRDVRVLVECDDRSAALPATRCTVDVRFSMAAGDEPVQLELDDRRRGNAGVMRVDGEVLGACALEPGQRASVSFHTTAHLAARRVDEFQWITPAMFVRHAVLGDVLATHHEGAGFSTPVLHAMRVTVEGPIEVETRVPDFVTVSVGYTEVSGRASLDVPHPTVSIAVAAPPLDHGPIQPGGPFLAGGARFDMSNSSDDGRFLLQAGYEIASPSTSSSRSVSRRTSSRSCSRSCSRRRRPPC